MSLEKLKEQVLVKKIREAGKVAIAYSGGIDSSYLLKIAMDTLGSDHVLPIVVNSELFSDDEFNKAIDLAENMNTQVLGVEMSELANAKIAANTPASWYYSKKLLYKTIRSYAEKEGYEIIADGMIMDDNIDFRPGLKARDEERVVSFLQEAGLYKNEIRELAKDAGVSNWNKVASCSVASRFPYGTKLTLDAVEKVFVGEKYLRKIGFNIVRIRVHGDIARIEVPENQFLELLAKKSEISELLKALGFNYVTLDIEGFKSGRMNDVLRKTEKEGLVQPK